MFLETQESIDTAFLGKRAQLAFVVRDMDGAIRYWTETLKVGPFCVIESSRGNRTIVHRGVETQMDMELAFAYMGDIQIEFVHQTNDAPSPYKEFLDSGREGLQHIAFWPKDFFAACEYLEARGFHEITSFYLPDGTRNVAYYETPSALGTMIEIVPMTADRTAYFSRMERLCSTWDGVARPIRRFADRTAFLASGEGAE